MNRSIFLLLSLFTANSGFSATSPITPYSFDFVAPSVSSVSDVSDNQIGLIVYDASDSLFKGYSTSGQWIPLSNIDTGNCSVFLSGYESYPSTNTKIQNYSTTNESNGACMTTVRSNATDGMSVTINVGYSGNYEISICNSNSAGVDDNVAGFSVNATALTTNISAPLSFAQGSRGFTMDNDGNSGAPKCFTRSLHLASGDVIRAHSDGAQYTNDIRTNFQMRFIGR